MARSFDFKRRGVPRRKRKPTYLIIAEGRNKTETNYFSHFQDQEKPYILRMVKAGSNTDIESLYKTICNRWEELELSEEEGDCAFIVFDLDNSESKIEKVETIIKNNKVKGIQFIASNPTFEIWFLLHFRYTSKYYADGKEVISDLKKYIPDYEKNKDVFLLCDDRMADALKNAVKLNKQKEQEKYRNPMTDVGQLVSQLI